MSSNNSIRDDQIEPLVRGYLENEAREVNLERNLAAIADRFANRQSLQSVQQAPTHNAWQARLRWIARGAVAACLVVGLSVAGYVGLRSEPASAFAIVSAAESELAKAVDRCYRVETQVPKAWIRNFPFLDSGTETLVWTRGDRFRVTTVHGMQQFTWGQDERHRLWVVCDPERGIEFDRDEVPPMFARTRAYLGLDARRLTARFLKDFNLQIEQGAPNGDTEIIVVRATAKHDRQSLPFNSARLEIERKSKIIRRMELKRIVDGTVRGDFSFTLLETASQPNSAYQLNHNLQPGGLVLGHEQFAARRSLLEELLERARYK